jgi:hypothetical protein
MTEEQRGKDIIDVGGLVTVHIEAQNSLCIASLLNL